VTVPRFAGLSVHIEDKVRAARRRGKDPKP